MYKLYTDIAGEEMLAKNVLPKQYLGIGSVDDIANAICYVPSNFANFITGSGFAVDDGY